MTLQDVLDNSSVDVLVVDCTIAGYGLPKNGKALMIYRDYIQQPMLSHKLLNLNIEHLGTTKENEVIIVYMDLGALKNA